MATSAATRTAMPARISRGLSRNGRRGSLLFGIQQIFEFAHELADVAKVPIYRSEPDVRDLVEGFEFFHDERADLGGRHFPFGALLKRALHPIGDRLDRRQADGPLLAGLEQAADQLLAIEPLTGPVLLDDHVRDFVD